MNDYYDEYGFIHDKPNADSNNPWIYTSYDFLLTNRWILKWREIWDQCRTGEDEKEYYIYRKPNDPTPPLSRDEAIGMDILGMPIYIYLQQNDFYLCRKEIVEKYSWIEAIIDIIKIAYETRNLEGSAKRNYMWEQKRYAAMKIGFKLMPHDVYYFKVNNGDKPKDHEVILFYLYVISSAIQKNYSARNICWAQLKQLGRRYLIKLFNQKENFRKYFGEKHPLVIIDA